MRLALIPPRGYEHFALEGTALMSLCIPSFYTSNTWSQVVREARLQSRPDLFILDNGAAEGEIAEMDVLLKYAEVIGADEVVLPDVLGDYEGTMKAIKRFFAMAPVGVTKFNWMAPLQGENDGELLKAALTHVKNPSIGTLGIPRIFIDKVGRLNARIDIANEIHRRFPGRFQIHFLGATRFWPGEIRAAARYADVRSMDTSMPFNFTIAGLTMSSKTRLVIRPHGYFTNKPELEKTLLDRNIQTATEWANGKLSTAEAPAS